MLDRIVARDAESLVAEATLPDESPIFEGHFPGFPLLPGVLMIECKLSVCCSSRPVRRHSGSTPKVSLLSRNISEPS